MARKRTGRYPKAFRQMAVERLKGSENIVALAEELGVALALNQDAMLLGACRKYESWLNGAVSEPVRSLHYFEPLVTELQEKVLPPGYSTYLRRKVRQLAKSWCESANSRQEVSEEGVF